MPHEFGPIYTFEPPPDGSALSGFADAQSVPAAWPNIAVEPSLDEPAAGLHRAAGSMAGASDAATDVPRPSVAPGVSPFVAPAAPAPAGNDWLSEVHASLNKLAQSDVGTEAQDEAARLAQLDHIHEEPARASRDGNRRITTVLTLAIGAAVVATLVLMLLPPELRPFDVPDIVGMVTALMDAPQPAPTNLSP